MSYYRFIQLSFLLILPVGNFRFYKQDHSRTKIPDDDIPRKEIRHGYREKSETRKAKEAALTAKLGNETSVAYKCHSILEACHQKLTPPSVFQMRFYPKYIHQLFPIIII